MEHALTKLCNINRDDWDLKVPVVLWAYRTTCKKLTGHTPLKLAHGEEVVMPMEYIIPSLRVTTLTEMANENTLKERLLYLVGLEEESFVEGFHQQVQKE